MGQSRASARAFLPLSKFATTNKTEIHHVFSFLSRELMKGSHLFCFEVCAASGKVISSPDIATGSREKQQSILDI
jgi:hypothetical protein